VPTNSERDGEITASTYSRLDSQPRFTRSASWPKGELKLMPFQPWPSRLCGMATRKASRSRM
jgi:hypothetical protein